ncbi:MAG: PKD domain-containing protein [Candidatus Bipolaricaulis sp.]|nr:PKD domain-containing protein [Candidatus Bipolaricaulis sp.]MDD5219139.1 PKD domain-containing protein [Candidatus Bipolaricaulis sp.]
MVPWGERRRGVPVFSLIAITIVLVSLAGCTPAVNHPPVAVADVRPTEGYAPFIVYFDAGRSHDPDDDSLSCAWTFDDGGSFGGATGNHTFAAGVHEITLTVTDDHGGVGTASVAVSVAEVPEGYVMKRFQWPYAGKTQYWDLIAPWSLYRTYRDRIRSSAAEAYEYGDYVEDPLDEPTIEDYAALLWERAGRDEDAFVECALSFCQGAIGYEGDPIGQEWPLYPLETLVDGTGDCEDTTILFVSLLRGRGVPASIGFVDTNADGLPDHVLGLVPVTPAREKALACPGVVAVGGVRYAVAETATDDVLPLGCAPWDLEPGDVYEIWSF